MTPPFFRFSVEKGSPKLSPTFEKIAKDAIGFNRELIDFIELVLNGIKTAKSLTELQQKAFGTPSTRKMADALAEFEPLLAAAMSDPWALTKEEEDLILTNSIERVLNNAIRVGRYAEGLSDPPGNAGIPEDASVLWQDCEALKPVLRKLWDERRDKIFRSRQPKG